MKLHVKDADAVRAELRKLGGPERQADPNIAAAGVLFGVALLAATNGPVTWEIPLFGAVVFFAFGLCSRR